MSKVNNKKVNGGESGELDSKGSSSSGGRKFDGQRGDDKGGASKGNKRGKGSNPRKDHGSDKDDSNRRAAFGSNDPSWTIYNERMLADTANFNYGYPIGMPDEFISRIPGIGVYEIAPIVSELNSANSATNLAFRSQYIWMRNAISGNFKNYDFSALGLAVIAISQIHSALAWLRRIYEVSTLVNPYDRYMPQHLLTTMGVNYNSLESGRAEFRSRYNLLVAEINKLPIPDVYNFRKRWVYSYTNLYRDNLTAKSQLYYFKPYGFYRYFEGGTSSEDRPELRLVMTPVQTAPGTVSVNVLLNYVEAMINSVMNSESIALIIADLIRAYPKNLAFVEELDDSARKCEILYDEGIQSQIANADNLAHAIDSASLCVRQFIDPELAEPSYLTCTPMIREGYLEELRGSWQGSKLLSLHVPDPKPVDTMYATRLTARVTSELHIVATGLEVLASFTIYNLMQRVNTEAGGVIEYALAAHDIPNTVLVEYNEETEGMDYEELGNLVSTISLLSCFDDHPRVEFHLPAAYEQFYGGLPFMDIDNFTIIPEDALALMQYAANLGAYNINPVTGKE